ncbi:MAG: histidine kinase [Chloroflexota bacterium]
MKNTPPHLPIPGSRWRGLTFRLFAWVIFPIIILLFVATFGSFALHQQEMRAMVGILDERAVRTAASAISEHLNSRAASIYGLSLRASDGSPADHILESSTALKTDFDAGLAFFSPGGELLAKSHWVLPALPPILEESLGRASTEPSFTSFQNSITGEHIIFITAAESPDAPIVVGALNLSTAVSSTLNESLGAEEQITINLIDRDGRVLFGAKKISPTLIDAALRGESGSTYIQSEDGEHVIAYSPISHLDWVLILEEPWAAVASPTLTTTLITPLALAPVLLLALVALWFGARQIVQPLQNLETRARTLAWGDFYTIQESVGGIEEIAKLQNTLIYLAEKVSDAQSGLRSYIGAITIGQEDERRRLARDLHDETLQSLIALNQRVQLAQINNKDDVVAERLAEIENLTGETIRDLRRVTHALRPLYLDDLGLVAALDMLAREMQESAAISVSFQCLGSERRLAPETELAFYRMAQEGLSNVIRHAGAEHASVSIAFSPDTISLSISDNGIGFIVPESPAEFAPKGHFGLLGLYERAELISAKLDLRSKLHQGTELTVTLSNSKA